ncbi:MAG: hypothetical protein ACREDO_06515 [Methyloceanibacter sp.]
MPKSSARIVPKASDRTLVTFLLDRTGSMEPIRDETIGAFNTYLDGLKRDDAPIDFTFLQFDSMSIDKICVAAPVVDVPRLTRDTYQPRASTPLIDAAYKTVKAVEDSMATSPRDKVVICFQTDGEENSSIEHSWNELNALIKEKAKLGWQFNFMGVGIDAYNQGARMGVAPTATVAYDPSDRQATVAAFLASADNARRYARAEANDTDYTPAQRSASRDMFFENVVKKTKRVLKAPIVDDIKL